MANILKLSVFLWFSWLGMALVGISQGAIAQTVLQPSVSQVTFDPPPGQDRPTQTAGGGSRGEGGCPSDSQPVSLQLLSAAQTTDSHPEFQVYVSSTTASEAEFSLFDQQGTILYETSQPLEQTPTVLTVALPSDRAGLMLGQEYYWMVAVVCDPGDRFLDVATTGLVERVPSDQGQQSAR